MWSIPKFLLNFSNSLQSNWVPLSDIRTWGTLNRHKCCLILNWSSVALWCSCLLQLLAIWRSTLRPLSHIFFYQWFGGKVRGYQFLIGRMARVLRYWFELLPVRWLPFHTTGIYHTSWQIFLHLPENLICQCSCSFMGATYTLVNFFDDDGGFFLPYIWAKMYTFPFWTVSRLHTDNFKLWPRLSLLHSCHLTILLGRDIW